MKLRNIIFIVTDTVRADNIGLYNLSVKTTPVIDSYGKNGIFFKNAYTTITCTDPAITAMMTGNYPVTIGLVNHASHVTAEEQKNAELVVNLAEILQSNNFYTAAIDWLGRWHKKGFDYYSGALTNPVAKINIADKFPFPLFLRVLDKLSVKILKREIFIRFYYAFFKSAVKHYDDAETIVNKAIKILQKRTSKPKFLYLHFWDAHAPHTLPKGLKSYLTDTVEDTYQAEINFIDSQLGRLNKFLQDTNQYDSTLFVLTGDHGENLSNHDIPFNHENLYDDVVKVPLIISHPQIKNKASTKLVQHIDIVPTLLRILKIKSKYKFDGIDILSKKVRKYAYFEDISYRKIDFPPQTRRRGLIIGNKKYIQTFTGGKEELRQIIPKENLLLKKEELFDLNTDRLEKNNLFSRTDSKSKYRIELFNIVTNLALRRFEKDPLYKKYIKTVNILKKVNKQYSYNELAIAWKGGKDTTTLMHIIRTFHKGIIPYKVFFNDTTLEFKEVYSFINQVKQLWNLRLTTIKHSEIELKKYYSEKDPTKGKELARLMKITAIKSGLKKLKIKGYMLGIRRDENPARQNEKHFSLRKNHIRIHPLLDFTEQDVWKYIKFFGVPYLNLYDKGYRSIGEKPFTKKVPKGGYERTGRDQEKEKTMTRLRQLGYW